jgi:cysteine-rich repeat protein
VRAVALPSLILALAAGCHYAVDVVVCRRGEGCPPGTSCDEALGICQDAAPLGPSERTPESADRPRAPDVPVADGEDEEGEEGEEDEASPPSDPFLPSPFSPSLPDEPSGPERPEQPEGPTTPTPEPAEGEGEGEGEAPAAPVASCGDGVTGPGEQCDDGNRRSGDGCSSTCRTDAQLVEIEPNDWAEDPGCVDVLLRPLTVRGAIDTMVYDSFVGAYLSELDSFWLLTQQEAVVRLELFDRDDVDDCSGTKGMFLELYGANVVTARDPATALLRESFDNGNGRCPVLTTRLPAQSAFPVVIGELTGDELIPSYRLQIATLAHRGDESEPNGVPALAERAAADGLDTTMRGQLANHNDVDVYAVDVPPGRGVRAEVIPSGLISCRLLNASVSLVDEDGNTLAARTGPDVLCPFIDGTGANPRHGLARNTTSSMKTLYFAVKRGAQPLQSALTYRVAFTVR